MLTKRRPDEGNESKDDGEEELKCNDTGSIADILKTIEAQLSKRYDDLKRTVCKSSTWVSLISYNKSISVFTHIQTPAPK